ncbi:hypothetical protein SAMN04488128_1021626 [Chitinophaga eiseniae]|uniref:Uncharacterized protein n=1 Tax=Chitinophaga eiseniae TaxID=634771 RepID=A0A1T4RZN9_9BACT|nr:hypothetical protein SAMN04488128_1021626 [Chitinophaga eiseniae]
MERNATAVERVQGLDLRDYLTRFDYRQFQPAQPPETRHTLTIDGQEYEINAIAVITEIDSYKIVTYRLRNDKFCEVLYTAAGELANQAEDFSQVIYARMGKVFKLGKLNGGACLLYLLKNY